MKSYWIEGMCSLINDGVRVSQSYLYTYMDKKPLNCKSIQFTFILYSCIKDDENGMCVDIKELFRLLKLNDMHIINSDYFIVYDIEDYKDINIEEYNFNQEEYKIIDLFENKYEQLTNKDIKYLSDILLESDVCKGKLEGLINGNNFTFDMWYYDDETEDTPLTFENLEIIQ